MKLLPELEHARDIADCGAFSARQSVVNAVTAELGEGAGTTVQGDRSSAGSVFIDEHMLLSQESVAVVTDIDGPNLEVGFRVPIVCSGECMDLILECARRTQGARGSKGEYAGLEVEVLDDGERLRGRSLRSRRPKGE